MTEADVVVVGAGPNGLVAAVALAAAGLRVVVLEAASAAGGGLRTEELTLPGFRHDVGATVHALQLASPAFRALDLARDGLELAHPPLPLGHAIAPGVSALLHRSVQTTAAGLGRDGDAWRGLFAGLSRRWEGLARAVLEIPVPPDAPRELVGFGLRGVWPATTVIRGGLREEPARALFAGLAAHAVRPLTTVPTSGFAVMLGALAHGVGWPVAVGGSQSVADALVRRLTSLGGELRTGHRVTSLDELPTARAVVLDVTPRQLLQIGGDRLPAGYVRRLARWRYGPGVFKLDWALDAPIPWRDAALAGAGTVHVGGRANSVVGAERAVWRGGVSPEPFVLLVQPTVADPSRAPAGKHTAWAYCHVPHGSERDMTAAIEARIETFAPGFRDRILARHALGPAALEAWDPNLVGGDIGGGSVDWRQLIARPRLALAPWATPVPGLYLCSSSTFPGGGAHGMGGWNAAERVLRDIRHV